jgi:hypothetical protein
MKIEILFALPGPQNRIQGDKLIVVAAATEHEDQDFLAGAMSDVVEASLQVGAYRAVRKVTLELDEASVLAMISGEPHRTAPPISPKLALRLDALH